MKFRWTGLILVLIFTGTISRVQAQCAMCKMNAEAATESMDPSIGQHLNTGILYLMALPYLIFLILFRKKIISFFRELKQAGRTS